VQIINLFESIKGFLKTPQCADCRATLDEGDAKFCAECRTILRQRGWQAISDVSTEVPVYAACDFNRVFKKQLYGYKYYGQSNGQWLSDLLIDYCRQDFSSIPAEQTLLVMIPPHDDAHDHDRLMRLAQAVANAKGWMLSSSVLNWQIQCKPQHTLLGRKERFQNLESAFSVADINFSAIKRIVILDDLITTGATLMSAAEAIKAQVARQGHSIQVEGLALARVPFMPLMGGNTTGLKKSDRVLLPV